MSAGDWQGRDLGSKTIEYSRQDAILYALAVGVGGEHLDLIYERDLRVLPTFGLTLAQWAPDVIAESGGYGDKAVHASQSIDVRAPLPASGSVTMRARVEDVWDKGSAAVLTIVVESDFFSAKWTIFAPGQGGFGGERGPSAQPPTSLDDADSLTLSTAENQALLYRLTGDAHDIHVDPEAAARIGQPRPILHGLCTLAAVTIPLATHAGKHPADLAHLSGRFSGVVYPGETLAVLSAAGGLFAVRSESQEVISNGKVVFS